MAPINISHILRRDYYCSVGMCVCFKEASCSLNLYVEETASYNDVYNTNIHFICWTLKYFC